MAFIFHNIWDVILPIDELIFFKMVIAPPTSDGFPTEMPIERDGFAWPNSTMAWQNLWNIIGSRVFFFFDTLLGFLRFEGPE